MLLKWLAVVFSIFPLTLAAYSQQTPTAVTQDPAAIALATESIAALTGTIRITDVTLTGTAVRTSGSDIQTGNVTLKALGTSDSRIDLVLPDGTRTEIRTSPSGSPEGIWLASGGSVNSMAVHNCLTDAAWFFPALTTLSRTSNPNLSLIYIGQESRNGISVQHVQFRSISGVGVPGPATLLAALTSTEVYLDSSSLLPVAFTFNTHPDDNELTNIPVEIDFSNYEPVNGVQIPFHIQKFLNGSLFLDLTIQNANLNSGLTDSAFASN